MTRKPMVAFGFLLALFAFMTVGSSALQASESDSQARQEAMKKLSELLSAVESSYVDELSVDEIVDKAMNGLLSNLDAHSGYLDTKKFKEMTIKTKGEFGGLGITVGMRDGAITVISPIDDTPAYRADIKAGDIILKIDNQSTIGMTLDEAVGLMRGKPKTEIILTLVRKGEMKPLTKKIIRDIIKIDSVSWRKFKNDVLYIRVSNFDKNVEAGVRDAIESNKEWLKGIVIDLRNNPGGLLDQAVKMVDLFVDDGVIVSQKGRASGENIEFEAHSRGTYNGYPMVVLVNGGSASASEIVSGALQDHKRAVVVGEKTFGKGSVQAILPLGREEAIRLTIARYYLPSGRTIQAVGVTPDIEIKQGQLKLSDNDQFAIKEAQLKKHLEAELEKVDGEDKKRVKKVEDPAQQEDKHLLTQERVNKDYQLKSALDILQALMLVTASK